MGLLTRGTPNQTLAKQDARARAKASKAGIDTTGALAVSRWNRDSAWSTMLVFPDRVDIHNARGSFTRTGRGVASVPIAEISSAWKTRLAFDATPFQNSMQAFRPS